MHSSGETITTMPSQCQLIVCQRCGRGFILAATYVDLVKRRGIKVIVPPLCPTCFLLNGPLPKQRGEVKRFSCRKQYGFIATEAGEDVFFHQKQLLEDKGKVPRKGQIVRCHVHYPVKGPEALNVELVEE